MPTWAPGEDIPAAVLQTQPHEGQVIAGMGKESSKAPRQAGSLLHAGRGCPMMTREDYNKAANCQILVAKGEGEADWERITVAQVDALDQDCYKPSFLPPKTSDDGTARCRLSSALLYPVYNAGKACRDRQEPTQADSSHLTAPTQPKTFPELADIGHFKITSLQPREKARWFLHVLCKHLRRGPKPTA